jgi:mRNA degradation ribonuclease J1/J2
MSYNREAQRQTERQTQTDTQVHASGHMSKEQLVEMVNDIQPKQAFPVHTENQQLFKTLCGSMQTIEQGKEYALK